MNSSAHTPNPFMMIRTTVEAEIPAPGVLTVSSALDADGKTGVAAGIARSLASAGYMTIAIDASGNMMHGTSVEAAIERLGDSARQLAAGCDYISLAPDQARTASATAIAALYDAIRLRYDYAIVDAAVISDGGLALSRAADGVVLAVREGRAVTESDRDAVALFERLRVRFLGVIATRDAGTTAETGPLTLLEYLQEAQPARRAPAGNEEPVRGMATERPSFARLRRLFSRSSV
jgi:Mrp family chromosome partitioning ATPase